MRETVDVLIVDLLDWIGAESRSYPEVLEVWRTSCPKLPVWEDANARGFLGSLRDLERGELVCLTPSGRAFLEENRFRWRRDIFGGRGEPTNTR